MSPNILIVDDNHDITKALSVMLKLEGIRCDVAHSPNEALDKLNQQHFNLVIQDMNFSEDMTSGKEGIKLFHSIREINTDIPIIIITAWTHVETAVSLVKHGAADYIGKPWDEDKLMVSIKNLLELDELRERQANFQRNQQSQDAQLSQQFDLCGVRYRSDLMSRMLQMATQVAHSNVPVLITGPNGAGKEKVAEIIQANSACKDGPFIKVNVGALSKELLEAELFGAEAGAYTGITKRRIGRFEAADKGTLFLDEIGNLSHEGQIKLLRVLQSGEFERVGSNQTIKVDVRVISATNSDLQSAIIDGTFREDLYYRLNVIELKVPALKQRKEDILPLVNLFLESGFEIDAEASNLLQQYDWPGNVRELQNVIKRAMLLSSSKMITTASIGIEIEATESSAKSNDVTREMIVNALAENNGNIMETAKYLGLSRSALYRRLKKFDISN
ncbi:sigma-54-dependent transcriptional regulator [Aliikangiella coralliicola]|uniref:Sigma-54-dependent Fis family transcriptional regulator n=1 Tax=Aliikangiella coralliicola TaxID=2592383 RepID=A0A545UGX5_9GAMM|nr:sigma-54 dependent transcriptional regulator [Aliikangiella coralliicola]TQV88720.1 sigma-54-dependent Fis family transcriptional regulator [Aliikangiella coralliicola]